MFNLVKRSIAASLFVFSASCASHSPIILDGGSYTVKEVSEDLETFVEFIKTTHPDITYTANLANIDAMADHIEQSFHDGMSTREAWSAMARMNPVFKDAHVGLRRPLAKIAEYESNGGKLFPVTVIIDNSGTIRLAESELESIGIKHGDELLSINGIKADAILETLAPRMRGNSAALGRLIMERYFAQYFWTIYGGYDQYVVRVRSGEHVRTITLPSNISASRGEKTPFAFKKLTNNIAYIDVSTFDISEKDRFQSFLANAFAQISANGIDTLLIDLRKNGGGAHDVSDMLMIYLTSKPYSSISRVKARITPENINRIPGAKLGAVVELPFEQIIKPPKTLPNRFEGNVYTLIGGLTYSQAIAFSSTLQDYKIATIIGEETEGPANQTGQVQSLKLPNTGFEVLAPIYIFTRKSGDVSNRGVIPDVTIKNTPLDSNESISTFLKMLEN